VPRQRTESLTRSAPPSSSIRSSTPRRAGVTHHDHLHTFNPNTIDERTRTLGTRTMITHELACDGVCRKGEGVEGLLTEVLCLTLRPEKS
jgi:hypothetical protein